MKYNKREPTVWADYPDSGLFLYQSMQYKLPAAMHSENLPVADSVGGRLGWWQIRLVADSAGVPSNLQ